MHGTWQQWLAAWGLDDKLIVALGLIAVDFLTGVAAAFKLGTFRLSYAADFLHSDVAQKVIPWGAIYVVDKATDGDGFSFLNLGVAAGAAYVVMVAALSASIVSNFRDLGVAINLPDAIAGNEARDPVLRLAETDMAATRAAHRETHT
jgi:hypothetical protein